MAKDETGILTDLRSALRGGASTRSPLFQWMLRNHDRLAETFEESRPNWTRVTELLVSKGFSTTDGKPLNPQSVRQMWWRVRQRHAAIQGEKRPRKTAIFESDAPVKMIPAEEPASGDVGLSPQEALERVKAEMRQRSGRKV
ncbi:hypothetical protein JL101_035760 (plasmid) [Skermanella rosea]|uniref:hypothetical protein n=1 Tax=Skermanella rosea TaxID=1817965 RepID=UPI0019311C86|nr:hypothetical protein [Skermanella rosea]UEM08009.1 hypothetical protein JL101_035760 [Skermanella rosea]